ncbi:MAG TPA: MFS transporter [Micromonosporaceae bacterium]
MSELTAGVPTRRHARAGTPPALPILVLLSLAQFMVILDVSVVNVALPTIGRSLSLSREALTWVITAYTVTFGGLLILGGRLADALGRKTTFLAGLTLFTLASLTAGLADSGAALIPSRVAQGVGAAILSPSALSILTTEFTGRERNRALGVWGAIGAAGAAVGVLVGGVLTAGPGWQWVFYVNIPVGVLVAVGTAVVVPARPRDPSARLDVPGALTGTAAVALVIYGLVRAGERGWTSPWALAPIGLGVLLALAFVAIERAAAHPLVPTRLVTRPPLPGAVVVMLVATGALLGMFFLNSIYLQHVIRYSPLKVGLVFLPVALFTAIGAHLGSRHVARIGPRPTAAAGLLVAATGIAVMAWWGVGGGLTALLVGFLLAALGIGATFVTAITTGLSSVEEQHSGVASGVFNTGHEVGGSLGIATLSTVAGASLVQGPGGAALTGFQHAYLAAAVASAVLAAASAAILLPRGRLASGTGPRFIH